MRIIAQNNVTCSLAKHALKTNFQVKNGSGPIFVESYSGLKMSIFPFLMKLLGDNIVFLWVEELLTSLNALSK